MFIVTSTSPGVLFTKVSTEADTRVFTIDDDTDELAGNAGAKVLHWKTNPVFSKARTLIGLNLKANFSLLVIEELGIAIVLLVI